MAAAVVVAANPTDRESKVSGCRNNIHTGEEIDLRVERKPYRTEQHSKLTALIVVGGFGEMLSWIFEEFRP